MSIQSNENLAYLLSPKSKIPQIGPEKGKSVENGITVYQSTSPGPGTSYRFLYLDKGVPVSALQVIKLRSVDKTVIANVYTIPQYRRKGLAAQLLQKATKLLGKIEHSTDLSSSGAAWAAAVQTRLQEVFSFWLNEPN